MVDSELEFVSGVFALTPAESKRLIAKGIASLSVVQNAYKNGRLVITHGSTTAYVAEEVLGKTVSKYGFCAGLVIDGELSVLPREERMKAFITKHGKIVDMSLSDILKEFELNDVLIKSGNAIDVEGNVGVLLASDVGGTIGSVLGTITARGSHLIMPVGMEKLIPSVIDASLAAGQQKFKYYRGYKVGLMPVVNAEVITEIEAIKYLTGADAVHIASGGIGGSEGAVTLVVWGTDEEVSDTFALVEKLKGEPPATR